MQPDTDQFDRCSSFSASYACLVRYNSDLHIPRPVTRLWRRLKRCLPTVAPDHGTPSQDIRDWMPWSNRRGRSESQSRRWPRRHTLLIMERMWKWLTERLRRLSPRREGTGAVSEGEVRGTEMVNKSQTLTLQFLKVPEALDGLSSFWRRGKKGKGVADTGRASPAGQF